MVHVLSAIDLLYWDSQLVLLWDASLSVRATDSSIRQGVQESYCQHWNEHANPKHLQFFVKQNSSFQLLHKPLKSPIVATIDAASHTNPIHNFDITHQQRLKDPF